jgi:RimJ/RimL family protein N-acetyltransferase
MPTGDSNMPTVRLRPIEPADLPILCPFQQDAESCSLAAVKPRETDNYMAHWRTVLADEAVVPRAILADGTLVGSINKFRREGEDFVGYWIAREHWGRGIASRALALLLEEVDVRPLRAQVAAHNAASLRVLERCGFVITGRRHEPATDRYIESEVISLILQ